jgi:hypothetical protein
VLVRETMAVRSTFSLAASLGAADCAPAPAADSASAITARQARAGNHAGRDSSCLDRAPADSVASPAYADCARSRRSS